MKFYIRWIFVYICSLAITYFIWGIQKEDVFNLLALSGIVSLHGYIEERV